MAAATFKRLLVGRPLSSADSEHQRIIKIIALAVFSSDAISSTAYATEEIMHVQLEGGVSLDSVLSTLLPISIVVCALLAVVVFSYSQTIHAYPGGGGTYVVSRENLGEKVSLIAGGSILTDYILTVAVSISAGTAAIVSAIPDLNQYRVVICLGLIALITVGNLRGVKESGRIFAVPTYVYIAVLGLMIVAGLYGEFFGDLKALPPEPERLAQFYADRVALSALPLLLVLRAFASGAVALTGIEAVADGVPVFRRPEARNATITLTWMAVILGVFFLGLAVLTGFIKPTPFESPDDAGYQTVLSLLGGAVFGADSPLYYVLQAATAAILVLAANTAYADFPRLSSIIANDGYLPRQLKTRGDRLVFSNGIVVLGAAASLLIVGFGGDVSALIPLYAVGVFTSFTLSQAGMVRYQHTHRGSGWRWRSVVSLVGAIVTAVVLAVVLITKFLLGAWLSVVVIVATVFLFLGVKRHYSQVQAGLQTEDGAWKPPRMNHTVVVLVGNLHRGVLQALAYARSLHPNHLMAVNVASDAEEEERIQKIWADREIGIPLEIVHSPYRDLTGALLKYLDELDERWENDIITVVIPEFVVRRWWEQLLHNQSALFLKARLLFRKDTVVTSVPYHLK